ncbi:MAG: heparinase, partial [Microvirga sp.]
MEFGPDRWRLYRLAAREAGRAMRESAVWSLSRLSSAPAPTRLLFAPQDLRTADPTIATDIYSGFFAFS